MTVPDTAGPPKSTTGPGTKPKFSNVVNMSNPDKRTSWTHGRFTGAECTTPQDTRIPEKGGEPQNQLLPATPPALALPTSPVAFRKRSGGKPLKKARGPAGEEMSTGLLSC